MTRRVLALTALLVAPACLPDGGPGFVGDDTITDVDGNAYASVVIGSQVWLAQDLRTTTFRDGTPIPNITDADEWRLTTTSGYCDYENVDDATYGHLYNAFAVDTGLLCPDGWHVPSDDDWFVLSGELADDGGALKEAGTAHWQDPNVEATNETGFTALPGGSRFSTGTFAERTYTGYWWTSTTGSDPAYSIYRFLGYNSAFLLDQEDYKEDGIAVRCVQD